MIRMVFVCTAVRDWKLICDPVVLEIHLQIVEWQLLPVSLQSLLLQHN